MKPIADAVLLDARQDVASARTKVVRSGLAQVAIRRAEGLVVFWYVFETQYVLTRFQAHDDKASVKQALNLRENMASPVRDIGTATPIGVGKDTVILDGTNFFGVQSAGTSSDPNLLDPDVEPIEHMGPIILKEAKDLPLAGTVGPLRGMARKFRTWISGDRKSIPEGRGTNKATLPTQPDSKQTSTASKDSTTFTAYPRLKAPPTIPPRKHFAITIGLASQRHPGTTGGSFTIDLPSTVAHFSLDVLVIADGFGMPEGGRYSLKVDRANPGAHSIAVPLVAPDGIDGVLLTTISVIYFYEHVPCGTAARKIAVIPTDTQPFNDTRGAGKLWTTDDEPDGALTVRPGIPAADLTVVISKPDGNPASGQFIWTFQSPHAVLLPALPLPRNLGMDSRELGTHIIEGIQNSEAQDMVALEIGGLGKDIADRMPPEFWRLLREVSNAVNVVTPGRPPTLLFLTAEAHVPWELALVEPPVLAGAPPYLGCQTNMARWPLSDSGRPALPPEVSIDVHQFAVVIGDYAARSGWRKLEKAESEGTTIASRYAATKLIAEPPQIKQLLTANLPVVNGSTGAEVVHFACHGEATQGYALDAALILGQGQRMSPTWLANAPLGNQYRPFLFLNACQVGKAGELLGSFSGFAGESLKGGFRGFLAPLWSVDDNLAHDIALEFYERVFGSEGKPPEPVAFVLRDLRGRFAPDTEKNSATRLAYVFYGHPTLTLRRI